MAQLKGSGPTVARLWNSPAVARLWECSQGEARLRGSGGGSACAGECARESVPGSVVGGGECASARVTEECLRVCPVPAGSVPGGVPKGGVCQGSAVGQCKSDGRVLCAWGVFVECARYPLRVLGECPGSVPGECGGGVCQGSAVGQCKSDGRVLCAWGVFESVPGTRRECARECGGGVCQGSAVGECARQVCPVVIVAGTRR